MSKRAKPKTVHARELSTLKMVAGNERKFTKVIDGNTVKEWVGIGWVDLRKATPNDAKLYPMVVRT